MGVYNQSRFIKIKGIARCYALLFIFPPRLYRTGLSDIRSSLASWSKEDLRAISMIR